MAYEYSETLKQVVDKLKQIDISEWKQTEVDGPRFPKYSIRDNLLVLVQLDDDYARSESDDKYVLIFLKNETNVTTYRGAEVRQFYEHLQQQKKDRKEKTAAVLEELLVAL